MYDTFARQPIRSNRKGAPVTLRLGVVDLFCGAGGLSDGFRQAGYRIIAGSDVDPDACATFALNFPEADVICGDLRAPGVLDVVLAAAAKTDLVIGGPPCQAFSQVRNHVRMIDDPRNSLYREFVNIVRTLQPGAFVMENVPGLDQMGVRQQILQDLSLEGEYRVAWQRLDAADFGVPQTRKRIIFTGIRRVLGIAPPEYIGTEATRTLTLARRNGESPTTYQIEPALRDEAAAQLAAMLLDPADATVVTAEQAIGDLRVLTAGTRLDELPLGNLPAPESAFQRWAREGARSSLTNVSVPRINTDTALRLEGIPQGGNYRDLPHELRERYLTGERWGPHNGTGRLGRRHYYAYRRLHPLMWSWTLNTKGDSVYHYSETRALSVREFARLQSFPDRFTFRTDPRPGLLAGRIDGGATHSRYRQAGNAVPPLLARAVAGTLAATLVDTPLMAADGSRGNIAG